MSGSGWGARPFFVGIRVMKKKVSEVFTPRRSLVNHAMYIGRPGHEKELRRALAGSQHMLIFGESGNGKSWLYKNLFEEDGVFCVSANCGNASRLGSITAEIINAVFPDGRVSKTSYLEGKSAGLSAYVAQGELTSEAHYHVGEPEPLLIALREIKRLANGAQPVVVLENLESIFGSEQLMGELADIIILLDDARYSAFNIKFLIVGTPGGVLDYFSKTKNQESVANRLCELPKVESLGYDQVQELVNRGFNMELGIGLTLQEVMDISRHVHNVTMGVAQRVHEYCEQLGYLIEDNGDKFGSGLISEADKKWLRTGVRQSYAVVEANLNSRDTAVARRNQVLYAIGRLTKHQFDSSDIEKIIVKEFPGTIPETNMGVGSILSELARGDDALLVRHSKTGQYRVVDPRYVMCIRTVLYKNRETGKVAKKYFVNS